MFRKKILIKVVFPIFCLIGWLGTLPNCLAVQAPIVSTSQNSDLFPVAQTPRSVLDHNDEIVDKGSSLQIDSEEDPSWDGSNLTGSAQTLARLTAMRLSSRDPGTTALISGLGGIGNQSRDLTGTKVRRSIRKGVKFLLKRQNNNRWKELSSYPNGGTALATLALLNSGVKPDDPAISETIRQLSRSQITYTYVVSLVTMVLAHADRDKYRSQIEKRVKWLEKSQRKGGGWGYTLDGLSSDSSNSQFAILALHEAQQAGVDVNLKIWSRANDYWESVYNSATGGFRYTARSSTLVSGSMTCAGISSLVIINENLNLGSSQVDKGQVKCCGRSESNDMIEKSINWLGKKFMTTRNPGGNRLHSSFVYYYRYSVERAGRLTGQRFFGRRDWYREIASQLINRIQRFDGSWRGGNGIRGGSSAEDEIVATSMALLFLSKGLRPVVASKYQYSDQSDWNRHPRGLHYLTRFSERIWNTKLNWQSIDGRRATANDLLETPVLMISGDGPMNLTKLQKDRIKKFIDNGGFLFIEANRGVGCPEARAFDAEIRGMLKEWFPASKLSRPFA